MGKKCRIYKDLIYLELEENIRGVSPTSGINVSALLRQCEEIYDELEDDILIINRNLGVLPTMRPRNEQSCKILPKSIFISCSYYRLEEGIDVEEFLDLVEKLGYDI
jgi:hypothetical protein